MTKEVKATSHRLTATQWSVVVAVGAAAAPAGPIVAGVAVIGAAGGCYLSNVMGWDGENVL